MATMNFSIPDDVKERFNQVFAHANKSAIVTRMIEAAIAQAERKRQSDEALKRILQRRQTAPSISSAEILQIRDELRAESDAAHGSSGK